MFDFNNTFTVKKKKKKDRNCYTFLSTICVSHFNLKYVKKCFNYTDVLRFYR